MDKLPPIYPWQQVQWSNLVSAVRSNQLAHGLLFSGIQGMGKADLAKNLVAFLHCQNRGLIACGACCSCCQMLSAQNPDHLDINVDASIKSGFITVNDIRRLIDWLSQTAHGGRCQTVIIHQADRLNHAAGNALLKTLEEPPGECYIFLLDHQRMPLMPTITSRLQVIDCSKVSRSLVEGYLAMHHTRCPRLLYDLLNGAPLVDVDIKELLSCRDKLFETLLALKNKKIDVVLLSDRILKNDVCMLLDLWLGILLDMLRLSCDFSSKQLIHSDRCEMLLTLLDDLSYAFLIKMADELGFVRSYWNSNNHLNQSLLLNRLLLTWQDGGL